MKIRLSLEEVERMVREGLGRWISGTLTLPEHTNVRFMHEYSDGSGESDVQTIAAIDYVEVDVDPV